jgi:hypothetical protein
MRQAFQPAAIRDALRPARRVTPPRRAAAPQPAFGLFPGKCAGPVSTTQSAHTFG